MQSVTATLAAHPMVSLSLILWFLVTLVLAGRVIRLQRKVRIERRKREMMDYTFHTPLRRQRPADFHPALREDDLGATLESEVRFIGAGSGAYASTSDTEAWILAVLSKSANVIFEFGTATGRTAYLMALNAPAGAKVGTITLSAQELSLYQEAPDDTGLATQSAIAESSFGRFLYEGTETAAKIEQLYGDSKQFDETPWMGRCDLIFIDGSHAFSYVKSDTEKALRMLAPGGIIVWHDYRGPEHDVVPDVYRYLNELGQRLSLTHLSGTSMVAYHRLAG